MKKPFLGVYNPSIILTYLGVFFSVTGMAILFSTERADASENMKWVLILLVLAGICDMFDGLVARRCKRTEKEKQFGIQLDSLADTVSFVAFPACILLFMCGLDVAGIIIAFFYIFAGIMRLGWFNVTTEENKGVYQGMPVTFSSAFFPLAHVIVKLFSLNYQALVFKIVCSAVGLLFILNFKLKKPRIVGTVVFAILALVALVALIVL